MSHHQVPVQQDFFFYSLFKQRFVDHACSFAKTSCSYSQSHTFIHLLSTLFLAVWVFRSVIFKFSRQTLPPTYLLLLYICQTEPQQEENGTMIHQQQERPKEKHHVKGRCNSILPCFCCSPKLSVLKRQSGMISTF